MRTLGHVLVLAAVVSGAVAVAVLVGLHGWEYHRVPLRVRGYSPEHSLLRPSGAVGHLVGIVGVVLMLLMQLYTVRKKYPRLIPLGSLPFWLEFHIFCGITGPVLVSIHTSFKFNGIVSVAYWSMMLVMLSGFVGRYLYIRIPKTLRGQELTHAEIQARAEELKAQLVGGTIPAAWLDRVVAFETAVVPAAERAATWRRLLAGEVGFRRELGRLRRELGSAGLTHEKLAQAVAVIAERANLLRRIAYLKKTKKLFDLWHVFHRPLAYVMMVIVTVHIAAAIYFGYAFVVR